MSIELVELMGMSPRWGFGKGKYRFFYRHVAPTGLNRKGTCF